MKSRIVRTFIPILIWSILAIPQAVFGTTWQLQGRVYSGNPGDTSTPVAGVTVSVYGSGSAYPSQGTKIRSATTNSSGFWAVQVYDDDGFYSYYHIIESDPQNYTSTGASSVGGTVKTYNWIQYTGPLTGKTLTGNWFFDKPAAPSNNPPVADAGGPYTARVNEPVQLDGSGSTDPDGDALTYAWDLDLDGQYDDAAGVTPVVSWHATYAGNIRLKVTDTHGAWDTDDAYVDIDEQQSGDGTVTGTKYNDLNQNGIKDPGESGLSGWRFYLDTNHNDLYDSGEPYAYTDASGVYQIQAAPGSYELREELQAGWSVYGNAEVQITLTAGASVTQHFGNYEQAGTDTYDYGDAPPSYDLSEYRIVTQDLFLGSAVDADPGPQPDGHAQGDDTDGTDDEDGIFFTSAIMPGQNGTLNAVIGASNVLEPQLRIYIDFDGNGSWDTAEKIYDKAAFQTGTVSVTYAVPAAAVPGVTYARAVLFNAIAGYYEGEVEDYEVEIGGGGEITVTKETIPADNQQFDFHSDLSDFTLFNQTSAVLGVMATGSVLIWEDVPAGWTAVSIQISGDDDGGSVITPTQDSVWVDYDTGENIHILFVNEKQAGSYDFGDAPDVYPTLLADNGARHRQSDLVLGFLCDAEADGPASPMADGDDQDGQDDEDGVNMSPFIAAGQTVPVTVTASGQGVLNAWIDFNGNHNWSDAGEHIVAAQPVAAGPNTFSFVVPGVAVQGLTFARFRLSSERDISYDGEAPDGEVEDYPVEIRPGEDGSVTIYKEATPADDTPFMICLHFSSNSFFTVVCGPMSDPSDNKMTVLNASVLEQVSEIPYYPGWTLTNILVTGDTDQGSVIDVQNGTVDVDFDPGEDIVITFQNSQTGGDYDFGDAPDPSYPTLLSSNGARHLLGSGLTLGSTVDAEPNGQPSAQADADNLSGTNDEDGVQLPPLLVPGQPAAIHAQASGPGVLNAWIDFNNDGDWTDAGEHVIAALPVVAGVNTFTVNVPAAAVSGQSCARFRLSSVRDLGPDGEAPDGEVEDYAVIVGEPGSGILTIVKEANPADNTPFWISVVWKWMGGAAPYRDPLNNTSTMSAVPAGSYDIGESVPPGWALKDITITGDTDNGTLIDLSNGSATVDLDAGENITITFKNEIETFDAYDFGDAPQSYGSASAGIGDLKIGSLIDAEPAQNYSPHADGDDADGTDDEDGVSVPYDLVPGQTGIVTIKFSKKAGTPLYLSKQHPSVWIDFDRDGSFQDPGEMINVNGGWTSVSATSGIWSRGFDVPANAQPGKTLMRVRMTTGQQPPVLSPTGFGGEGEVEDYEVEIKVDGIAPPAGDMAGGMKWNDLNGDGIQDAGEPGLAGWTVWIDLDGNGIKDAGESAVTQTDGSFVFYGLPPGIYEIHEDMQAGWTQTFPGGPGPGIPGTHMIQIQPGQPAPAVFFGNYRPDPNADLGALKWNQPPVSDPETGDTIRYLGWQIPSVTGEAIAADDWFCHDPRPVTGIRWWGSYDGWDGEGAPPEAPAWFHIGVWTTEFNADSRTDHPRELLREWFVAREQCGEIRDKHHMHPSMAEPLTCFRYTFMIPQDGWFHQEGDRSIYWIHIAASYEALPGEHHWGWLTRERYFHSDGLIIHDPLQPHPGSVYTNGESIELYNDMAFVLTTDEYADHLDFGDAPDAEYGTTMDRNGPKHLLRGDLYLGSEPPDEDPDGQASDAAQGDDADGTDDEDGVVLVCPLTVDGRPQIQVNVTGHGFLNIWLDVDRDGRFMDPDDHVVTDLELDSGDHILEIEQLDIMGPGEAMSRFRYSSETGLWVHGYAMDGEVEDHLLNLNYTSVGDAGNTLPKEFRLYPAVPNPFNPVTAIRYDVPVTARVRLTVYNIQGQVIRPLADKNQEAGSYTVLWDGLDRNRNQAASGIYLVRLETDRFCKTSKMILLR
ncbi:T9SS type A sorting domain-containing protein [bacterium]|nr:T9SS type A sorting domain-containing protein [bacterium]